MVRCINKENPNAKPLEPSNIRLWKCSYMYSSLDKFVGFLKENKIGLRDG